MICKVTLLCLGETEDLWAAEALCSALGIGVVIQAGEGGSVECRPPALTAFSAGVSRNGMELHRVIFFFLKLG